MSPEPHPLRCTAPLAVLALVLGACSPVGVLTTPGTDGGPLDDDTTDDDADDDTSGDDDASPPLEHVGGVEDPAGWMFTLDSVHSLDIQLEPSAVESLWIDPYGYVQGDIVFDGAPVDDVGVRLKGRIGSFRDLSAKAAFKIDINRFVDGQTFHGLEKLTLNNMIVDCSFAKERLAFDAFRAMDIPAPRAGYVWVTVNGEPYGLYLNVETPDDVFLARNYEDPGGNLYEAEYILYPNGSYLLVDFNNQSDDHFELEEGVDVQREDVRAITQALDQYAYTDEFFDQLDTLVDWDHHLRMVSAEQWIGQLDGYSLNTNNYRVYFDPADGKAELLPWDLDYAFQYDWAWGMSWYSPLGRLSQTCWADPTCQYEHTLAVDAACDIIDDLQLAVELAEIADLVMPYVAEDPRRECSLDHVAYYQDVVHTWTAVRSAEVRAAWGL